MKKIFLALTAILIISVNLYAQQGSPQEMPPGMRERMESGGGDSSGAIIQIKGTLIEGLSGNFSATFQGTPLQDVIRLFAMQSGLNIIVTPKVQATITANFKDAPIKDAFYAILSANGLYYLEQGNIIKILTLSEYQSDLKKSYLVTQTYDASIIDLENLVTVIRPFLTPGIGNISLDKQSSKIIVTDVEDNFKRIERVINEVSSLPKMVEIETRIVQVALEDGDEIGIRWEYLDPTKGGSLKIQHLMGPDGGFGTGAFTITGLKEFDNLTTLNAVISLLAQSYDLKIVAKPRILAMNRGSASILIGDKVPYIKSIIRDSATSEQTSQIEFVDVGIKLEVKPTITINNEVKIEVKVERSSHEFIPITSTENAPKVITTEVISEAIVRNEETIVIGGLIRTETYERISGIPFLSRIPVLKYLFSHTKTETNRSELLIFLTPRIITDGKSNINLGHYNEAILREEGFIKD